MRRSLPRTRVYSSCASAGKSRLALFYACSFCFFVFLKHWLLAIALFCVFVLFFFVFLNTCSSPAHSMSLPASAASEAMASLRARLALWRTNAREYERQVELIQEEGEEDQDLFYRSSASRRAFTILKDGAIPLVDGSSAILPFLSANTNAASDILSVALQICKVVVASDAEDKREVISKILEATKVPKPKVASGAIQLLSEWNITLFEMTEPEPEPEPESEADGQGEEGAPKAAAKEP